MFKLLGSFLIEKQMIKTGCKFFNIISTIFKLKSININLEKKGTALCLLGNML